MIALEQWCLLILFAGLVAQDTTAGPQIRFCEPIVSGPIAGWIVGDIYTGVIFGLAAQLIWGSNIPAGMSAFFDVYVGTVAAVVVGVLAGGSAIAFLWIIPVGYVGSALTHIERRNNERIVASVQRDDTPRMVTVRHMSGWIMSGARGVVTGAIGVVVGIYAVVPLATLIESVISPAVLWAGIVGVGSGIALSSTWRYGNGRASVVGALSLCAVLLVMRYLV